jgi:hypothetical protein
MLGVPSVKARRAPNTHLSTQDAATRKHLRQPPAPKTTTSAPNRRASPKTSRSLDQAHQTAREDRQRVQRQPPSTYSACAIASRHTASRRRNPAGQTTLPPAGGGPKPGAPRPNAFTLRERRRLDRPSRTSRRRRGPTLLELRMRVRRVRPGRPIRSAGAESQPPCHAVFEYPPSTPASSAPRASW